MSKLVTVSRSDLKNVAEFPAGTTINTVFYNITTSKVVDEVDTLSLRRRISGSELNSLLRSLSTAAEVRTLGFGLETEESVVNRNIILDQGNLTVIVKYNFPIDLVPSSNKNELVTVEELKEII